VAVRRDVSDLVERLARTGGLDGLQALNVGFQVAEADEDIWRAAQQWARTGRMPDAPRIEGWTPQALAHTWKPAEVFSALMLLRKDPVAASDALAHSPHDLEWVRRGLQQQESATDPQEDLDSAQSVAKLAAVLTESPIEPYLGAKVYARNVPGYEAPPSVAGRQSDLYVDLGRGIVAAFEVKQPEDLEGWFQGKRAADFWQQRKGKRAHLYFVMPHGWTGRAAFPREDIPEGTEVTFLPDTIGNDPVLQIHFVRELSEIMKRDPFVIGGKRARPTAPAWYRRRRRS